MHCCEGMREALVENVAIVYIPKFREYGIRILDGGTSFMKIEFCPWCGSRLPSDLRDAWFEELERLGLEPDSEALPNRLKTDAWWNSQVNE
jgi:hypothetical protein